MDHHGVARLLLLLLHLAVERVLAVDGVASAPPAGPAAAATAAAVYASEGSAAQTHVRGARVVHVVVVGLQAMEESRKEW